MNNPTESPGTEGKPPGSKLLTAVGHTCGLAAFLGVFIFASAYSSDPNSGMVAAGIILAVVGAVGFVGARWIASRR